MPKLPSGSVFKRRYRDSNGQMTEAKLWTIKYYVDGKPKQEPTETADHGEAVAFLRRRMADNAVATVHTGYPERVTMNQLFDLLVQDYILRKKRSLYDCETRVNARLRPYFGGMKAQGVGTATLRQYIQRRRGEEAQDATINRELALVRRALNLGAQEQPPLVLNVPHFPMLPVDNARQGTLDHEPYRLLRDALPLYARIALVIAYYTGARHGEISSIQRAWVNLKAGRINLPGRVTKNGKPRYLPIYGEMKGELDMWL